jgi:FG-GAP-like repeat/FG-GAP repeat
MPRPVLDTLEPRTLLSVVSFAPAAIYSVGGAPAALLAVDLNGDHNPDIAAATKNGTLSILLGNSDGTFAPALTIPDGLPSGKAGGITSLADADLNGHVDLLVTNDSAKGQISVLLGNGDGTFSAPVEIAATSGGNNDVVAMAAADLNGDGKPDLVTVNNDGSLSVLLGNGDGTFAPFTSINLGDNYPSTIAIADLNGDNKPDLILGGGGKTLILTGNGDGTFAAPQPVAAAGDNGVAAAVADVNGDGKPDLIVNNNNGTAAVLLGNGDGVFQLSQTLATNSTGPILSADFNNDHQTDLLIGDEIFLGNADGTFAAPVSVNITGPTATADFNGDGKADLLIGYKPQRSVGVLLNTTRPKLKITSAPSATFMTSLPGTFTITAAGLPTSALTEKGALPTGLTFVDNGNGTALLSGTPAADTGGTYQLIVKAINGVAANARQTLTIIVDQPPAITSNDALPLTVSVHERFSVTTTGYPAPALIESGALPPGLSFLDLGNGAAALHGTPAIGSGGRYDLTIKAKNGVQPKAVQSFTITIGQPPAITSAAAVSFTPGTPGAFTVTTTGFPTAALTEIGNLPGGLTFTDNGDGTAKFSGAPAADSGGTYDLTIKAKNGLLPNARQSFVLTVNQSPLITSPSATTFTVGSPGTFNITTTGFPAPAITDIGTLPNGVSFQDNGNGSATIFGMPTAPGIFNLTLKAKNSVPPSSVQSFTLTVDQAPSITSGSSAMFTIGQAGSFQITTSSFPVSSLMESGVLPTGVTFKDHGDGTAVLSGAPAAGTAGTYDLTLTAANGVAPDSVIAFTLIVS